MKPYLDNVEKHIADISDNKRREWLEAEFKHMYSRRPRHILPPEIYHWERIYKIRHQTRPFEARKRPFEQENNRPHLRRYNEHVRRYIPKKFREVNKYKQKFEDTYYPWRRSACTCICLHLLYLGSKFLLVSPRKASLFCKFFITVK